MLAIWGATIMAGPMLGPVLGGVITDLASWRWIFAVNAPIGTIALLGLRSVPSFAEPSGDGRIDGIGIALLITAVAALQLALERSIGRLWPPALETIGKGAIALTALAAIVALSRRSQFHLFRFDVFRDVNFAVATVYNFMIGALLFTTIVFVPALSEGPLGWDATQAGLALAPRGVGTMATMLAVLQARIESGVSALSGHGAAAGASPARAFASVAFAAYTGCFRTLAISAMAIIPGILLFRVMRGDKLIITPA